jgi:localization factor PodJL
MKFRTLNEVVNPAFTVIRGKSGYGASLLCCFERSGKSSVRSPNPTGANMRPVPWHVKGVHPDAREVAREAARRSGVSVGAWLNSLIINAADQGESPMMDESMPVAAASPTPAPAPARAPASEALTSIGRQIDELKWRLETLSRDDSARQAAASAAASAAAEEIRSARLADAIARIDRQLDRLSRGKRPARAETDDNVDDVLAEITARQHALDDEFTEPKLFDLPDGDTARRRSENAAVEKQLQEIAAQIKALQGTMQLDGLASGLTRTIEEAAPKKAIEAIEEQLRHLTGQVEAARLSAPAEHVDLLRADIAGIRSSLAEAKPQAVAAIEQQVRDLTDEVAQLKPLTDEIAAALRREFIEIGKTIRESMPQSAGASLEDQMRVLTEEIGKLSPSVRAGEIADALRKDLGEIAETLRNAVPPGALASLEGQVRELGARVEGNRASLQDHPVIAEIERSLADLRHRLEVMAPIGDVASLAETVRTLSARADAIASEVAAPERLHQLDEAIATLREVTGHIATPADIAALSRDIQALAEKVDNSVQPEAVMTLDRRLAEMAAAFDSRHAEGTAIPPDLEALFEKLSSRLDSIELRSADPGALHGLDGRLAGLSDKLDASHAQLGRLDTVERGVADLVDQIQALRTHNDDRMQAIQRELIDNATRAVAEPAEAIRRDVATLKELQSAIDRRTQDTFEAVYGTIEQVVDRLASIEEERRPNDEPRPQIRGPHDSGPHDPGSHNPGPHDPEPSDPGPKAAAEKPAPVLVADAPALVAAAVPLRERLILAMEDAKPGAAARLSLASDLPPDAPLEPGSGGRRGRAMAGAIDRIAGPDAVPGTATPAETEPAVRPNFVAVARRAAQGVGGGQSAPTTHFTVTGEPKGKRTGPFTMRFGPQIKAVIVGISVIAIVLGALRLALDLFSGSGGPSGAPATEMQAPETAPITPPAMPANPPTPGKGAGLGSGTRGAAALPPDTPRTAQPAAAAPSPARDAAPKPQEIRDTAPFAPAPAKDMAKDFAKEPLPAAIGSKALIAAATSGDPAASYEVGARFADGTAVPQDLVTAASWFERAARSGIAMAQFRLGTMYEKGLGLKKDLQEARRLYLAAADKGNAKAMHNLAVLYAEGIDGKPDYPAATQWFRKAATYGLVDSEYNLAILYARGVGIDRNLVESYKWFALAARGGDKDAGKKALDIAAHLDEQQLTAVRQAVESFVPQNQPDDAVSVKTPPGGWDREITAARKVSTASR